MATTGQVVTDRAQKGIGNTSGVIAHVFEHMGG
jgi:hypothetical protein